MRHEADLDTLFYQCAHDLPGNLRAFPLVGRGKRLIKEYQGMWPKLSDDLTHATEFFIQLAAFHSHIFFPFEVREQALADIGTERLRRDKHAALHHHLR